MSLKVLYVEDEPFLARIVSDGLASSGYDVEVIADGQLAIDAYNSAQHDICILDIMLPSKDGFSIAKELRQADAGLPIIFLSAKVLPADVVEGFRSGGNDYLKKPFSMDELLIRMEALLQRFGNKLSQKNEDATIILFGNCRFDPVRQKLHTSNGEHPLSFKECALLKILLDKRNEVIERRDILQQIWGDDSYYNTRSMDVYMTRLRKILKDHPEIEIMNLRGIGFKLICS
jgi:DNA-binding response OmpR family regulator